MWQNNQFTGHVIPHMKAYKGNDEYYIFLKYILMMSATCPIHVMPLRILFLCIFMHLKVIGLQNVQ